MNTVINPDILKTQWPQLRGKVLRNWKALTAQDLVRIDGHFDVLVELLHARYGYAKPYIEDEVLQFIQAAINEPVQLVTDPIAPEPPRLVNLNEGSS